MEHERLTLGSLFDGSGGFPLGGLLAGIQPVWASEIEPFPIRVTTKRMPFVKHYGDVSKLDGGKLEPVDIITFGSPCQDMSIAGRREGLAGSRSCLFYEAIRIVKEMRCATNGRNPRYIVWENVRGAFSSNHGEDLRCVLESVCRIADEAISIPEPPKGKWTNAGSIVGDGFSVAWRLLDAQYWGVPQRRKRIYLVADFNDQCAGKILFESEGVSGYSAEGFRAWQRAAGGAANCLGTSGGICLNDQGGRRMDVTKKVAGTLRAEDHGHPPCVLESTLFLTEESVNAVTDGKKESPPALHTRATPAALCFENHRQDARYRQLENVAPTVSSIYGTGGINQPFVVEPVDAPSTPDRNNEQPLFTPIAFGICSKESNSMKSDNPHSGFYKAATARTLDANGGNPACHQGGIAVVSIQGSMIGRTDKNGPQGSGINENVSFTLDATDRHAVSYCMTADSRTQVLKEQSPTLKARDYKDPPVTNGKSAEYVVRRLTTTECARLQGFPDWWCDDLGMENPTDEELAFWRDVFTTYAGINGGKPKSDKQILKWLKEPHSNSAEYKMWGNGIALPNAVFVLSGIAYYAQNPTM